VRERCRPAAPATTPKGSPAAAKDTSGGPATPLSTLSSREIEVLRLIGKGLSRVDIAAELSRSAKTIDGHQEHIMNKLSIDSRSELMRFAIREGLAEA
jgi:DNA-binding NarL/FixJ family response regulator